MTLGEKIRTLRMKKCWNQTQLGSKINVTKASISGYENNTRNPDKETLVKLAHLFEVSTDYLLGNEAKYQIPFTKKQEIVALRVDRNINEDKLRSILDFIDYMNQK